MNRIALVVIMVVTGVVGAVPGYAASASEEIVGLVGPVLVDDERGQLYSMVEDGAGTRRTAVLAAADGTLLSRFDVGGPMALDASRGWLYVSTGSGVVAIDTKSGQIQRTLPTIPAKTWRGSGDFLPPVVVPESGDVLVVSGPKVTVFGPDGTDPVREIPFTSVGFQGPGGELLVADDIVFDPARGLLYGSFLVHSQASSGIGGSFTVYEIDALDVASGQVNSKLEVYNLNQMAVDAGTGDLVINTGGDVRTGAGGNEWRTELNGANLAPDQDFQVDSQRRRVYVKAGGGPLLELDLDSLILTGVARLDPDAMLVGYDPTAQCLYLVSADGKLTVVPLSALGDTFAASGGDGTTPDSPVRGVTILPDGGLATEWENNEIGFSSDGGQSWSDRIAGGTALAASPQLASDQTLLLALDGLGVFRSEDGGKTWRIASAGLRNFDVEWIAFSPAYAEDHPVYLYARTGLNMFGFPRAGELYRSQDGGRTWQVLPSEPRNLESVAVSDAPSGAHNLAAVRADGPSPGPGTFALSSDGGVNWGTQGATPAFPVVSGLSLAPLYAKWGVGFIFGTDGVLYRSQDFGQTWSPVLSGTPTDVQWGYSDSRADIAYGPDIESGRPVFLVLRWNEIIDGASQARGVLYVSQDGGLNWSAASVPGGKVPTAVAVPDDFAVSGRFYLGLGDGSVMALNWADVGI